MKWFISEFVLQFTYVFVGIEWKGSWQSWRFWVSRHTHFIFRVFWESVKYKNLKSDLYHNTRQTPMLYTGIDYYRAKHDTFMQYECILSFTLNENVLSNIFRFWMFGHSRRIWWRLYWAEKHNRVRKTVFITMSWTTRYWTCMWRIQRHIWTEYNRTLHDTLLR